MPQPPSPPLPRRRTTRVTSRSLTAALAAVLTSVLALGAAAPAGAAAPTGKAGNPYAGARGYVDPEWSARAAAEPGGAAVAGQPTAVWLDEIADVGGRGDAMGLRDHLDAALAQNADLVQLVLYDLPGRDCERENPSGELGPAELDRYKREFVDPIADVLADPDYADLRIAAVVEPNSLPRLVTNTGSAWNATFACEAVMENGAYVQGVGHALAELGALPNVHPYLDISHHGLLGWEENRDAAARLLYETAARADAVDLVRGVTTNVANYSVPHEEHFDADDTVHGVHVRQSHWVDWNPHVDEVPYALAFRDELIRLGFDRDLGVVVDTSRNGWGGPGRPAGPGPENGSVDDYVDGSRLDRRISPGNWCNQDGAGLGERPAADPEPGIDAYAWIKNPGISDGAGEPSPVEVRPHQPMCDPAYGGPPRGSSTPSGAVPGAPAAGEWFPAYFRMLLANAWPPLP
ncbi:cellobiohydrolase [Streptomyces carminius]|uniref:Glucanase n=1 Tax=Streptomyces carminius TaxID=2665496 RepID=A0A2M8LT70_9ACTN|nr:glycoside hydrolase family 6 protein [Streptomyces carminius]PJE95153.1 cellobiohydrolase [Streptomyces carminius]